MAKISMIIFMVWKGLGGTIILYLAGLQNIPRDYYEAAMIDGAGSFLMTSENGHLEVMATLQQT